MYQKILFGSAAFLISVKHSRRTLKKTQKRSLETAKMVEEGVLKEVKHVVEMTAVNIHQIDLAVKAASDAT